LRHINPEKLIAIGRALTQMASITILMDKDFCSLPSPPRNCCAT